MKSFLPSKALALICLAVSVTGAPLWAQEVSTTGATWSSSWGFPSASDRSVLVQQAQAILNARNAGKPTTVQTYYTTNDNRSNYVDANSGGDLGTIDFHIGEEIGQNTNSIGSMNTGTTNIDITGSSNTVTATNSADNAGCVDGSINPNSLATPGMNSLGQIDISIAGMGRACN